MDSTVALPIAKPPKTNWFVMRAYKCEKLAEEKLCGKDGLEYFIPKRYVLRIYHGTKTKRLVPVIPSLVFVHASHGEIIEFKKRHNFLQFAMWEKQSGHDYITVPDNQMESFIKVATQYESNVTFYRPDEIDLKRGTRVRILGGDLDGVEGTFVRVQGRRSRRVVVLLDGIMAVAAEVQPDLIEVIE